MGNCISSSINSHKSGEVNNRFQNAKDLIAFEREQYYKKKRERGILKYVDVILDG